MVGMEVTIDEPADETGFTDSGISDEYEFEGVIELVL